MNSIQQRLQRNAYKRVYQQVIKQLKLLFDTEECDSQPDGINFDINSHYRNPYIYSIVHDQTEEKEYN